MDLTLPAGAAALTACRMCGGTALFEFLDLGRTPLADDFRLPDAEGADHEQYPLRVLMCEGCGLAQLGVVVAPELLYRRDYPYESSTTAAGRAHWARFARAVRGRLALPAGALVVDIGSNVGVLLSRFRDEGMTVQGVEPAPNIAAKAVAAGVDTLCAFFDAASARSIVAAKGRAAVVTATNVFAHVDDLAGFMGAVDLLLDDRGVLVIEAPYFANLVAFTEYDTVYHEHLSYLSVRPMARFMARHGMELIDVEQVEIHGGSLRYFAARTGRYPVAEEVARLVAQEEATGLHARPTLAAFAGRVRQNREDLLWLLRRLKSEGHRIAAVSAPAKGMTLLNYCGIDQTLLEFVTEKSALKLGRVTPGAAIPVLADEELVRRRPEYALLLAWNFAEEIMANLGEFRARGGRFIIPIPTPRILS